MDSKNTVASGSMGTKSGLAVILTPGPEATPADVTLVEGRISSAVAAGQPPDSIVRAALLDPRQLTREPVGEILSGPHRAFFAGLPLTLAADGGTPDWAHGMVTAKVAPSLLTADGLPARLHWVDSIVQMTIIREGDPRVIFSLPLPIASPVGHTLKFGAGSIWFAADLFASAAAGGFAGLRVSGGILNVDTDMTIDGLQISIPATATLTITLELDQVAKPPDLGGPGADERATAIHVPKAATIILTPEHASLSTSDAATLDVYGVTLTLTPSGTALEYDETTHDLILPLAVDSSTFTPVLSASAVVVPSSTVPLQGGAWAIPVAFATPNNLGKASGAGALRLVLGPGLTVKVLPLDVMISLRQTMLSVGPSLLEITGDIANSISTRIPMWDEQTPQTTPSQSSSILLAGRAGDRLLVREGEAAELVVVRGECTASIDRPLFADGTRLDLAFHIALWGIELTNVGTACYAIGSVGDQATSERKSIVLENALLLIGHPRWMIVSGQLTQQRIESGTLRLTFPLFSILPILPDPYAANFAIGEQIGDTAVDTLMAAVKWTTFKDASLEITSATGGGAIADIILSDRRRTLLDVSTNTDLLGVALEGGSNTRIDASVLRAAGASLAVFTVPGVSWEPVEVHDSLVIPQPPNDGISTTVSVRTVRLTPVEPAPLLRELIGETHAGRPASMQFMLPFGLVADASLPAGSVPKMDASFDLVDPAFPNGLQGGFQLMLRPPHPESSTSGFPGNVKAAAQSAKDVLGSRVWGFFHSDFGPNGKLRIVPVRRIDLSGYGNSIFSDWSHPDTSVGVNEARFDVLVGRTSYEVIQVVSIIYPWCIRAVRTITLARQAGGRVLRTDKGWQAISDGTFDLPPLIRKDGTLDNPPVTVAHLGPVVRVTNIHNIIEQSQIPPLHLAGAKLQAVSFDGDVIISSDLGVPDGAVKVGSSTIVPSHGLTGYMQILPVEKYLTPDQFSALMQNVGSAGGSLACTVDLGGSTVRGPLMRATGVSVSAAGPQQAPELVVALLGTLRLPSDGNWILSRMPAGATAPQALDPTTPVPLIRPNGDPMWHIADPADIDNLDTPSGTRYGILQATGTQRIFFPRPRMPQGGQNIVLPESPNLADIASLLNATGLFPDLSSALAFDQPPQMTAIGDKLTVKKLPWSLAGISPKKLIDIHPVQVVLEYADENGTPATATVLIDPQSTPSWTIDIGTISIVLIIPPFGTNNDPLLRLTGSLHADAQSAPNFKNLVVHYGGALNMVEEIFSRLQELAKFLPGSTAQLDIAFSEGRLTIRDSFTLPNLPLGIGQITDVALDLGLTVSLSPPSLDFIAGIANADKPFHWLVSPLSGTGAVDIGSKDGNPTLLVQGGLGVGLGIDVGVASGSASVVLALQVDNRVMPLELKVILTGKAAVEVLDGVASATLMLSAAMGIIPDALPIPHEITLFADVAVGIHISVCWVANVDFDGSWHVSQTLTSPIS